MAFSRLFTEAPGHLTLLRMMIEFADVGLERICTDEAHRLGLPAAVIKAARRKLIQLEAASDERDLRNLVTAQVSDGERRPGQPRAQHGR